MNPLDAQGAVRAIPRVRRTALANLLDRQAEEQDVAEAIRVLNVLGWASVAPSHGLRRELDFAELVG
ncbi:MAG: hypothetical protein F4076_00520 [Acidimicrobiaceae bacterium]|nr:hypothetical protein [Acidimicrobiaceae bacterium]MYE76043.1 hypothetical protein [Acidimicrobiaceae bacterium]MYJ40918.1 hypothetical protein [Acidimicrobiaceae bacterium]